MIVKLLTLNLFLPGSNKLFLKALDFLQKEQADIMFFQEVYDSKNVKLPEKFRKREQIKKIFPDFFDVYSATFIDNRTIEGEIAEGFMILSRFPLSQVKTIALDLAFGEKYDHDSIDDFSYFPAGFLSCQATIDKRKIQLINVHGPVNNKGEENDSRRQKLLEKISNELNTDGPIILAGDSNALPSTDLIKGLEAKLYNPFKDFLKTTFNIERKNLKKFPGFATAAVDILMFSHDIKVLESKQPQVDVSDHLPLVAIAQVF